jgi:hypothetical protein
MRALSDMDARSLLLVLLLGAASSAGCAGTGGPSDTLRAYASALQDKRVEDAYKMLSDEAKRSISLEAFRRMVLENPDDVLEIARALARPSAPPVVTATVTMPNGDELALVLEDGKWRVDAAAVDLYGQSTPRQALAGFLRAHERRRYDVLVRYIPDADREGGAAGPLGATGGGGEITAEQLRAAWEGAQKEETDRVLQALRAALPTATIEENGDTASMSYGSGGTVSFLRERGLWKIRDF